MAGKSVFSCILSFLRPWAAHRSSTIDSSSNLASSSPWAAPICTERRLDSSSSAAAGVERVCAAAASPSVPPFTTAVDEKTSLREFDPASFLIERLDQGWFTENVMHCEWWDICTWEWSEDSERETTSSRSHFERPTTSSSSQSGRAMTAQVMLWDPNTHPNWDSTSSNRPLLPDGSRIRTPGSNFPESSPQKTLRKSIEMMQPPASASSSGLAVDRDPRGLPGSGLRRLPKVYPDLDMPIPEEKRQIRHHRTQPEDMSERLGRVGHKRTEIRNSAKLEPSTKKQISGPSEKERSSKKQMAGPSKKERSSKKQIAGPSEKERRRAEWEESMPLPAPPTRRRRGDRIRSSTSATDDECEEVRGCIDLGFNFNRNDLSPRVVSLLPGLKAYQSGEFDFLGSPNKSSARTRAHSPKRTVNADSSLLKWHIPSSQDGNVDMKAHLKYWAHSVASRVSAEC